ncbi:GNAT family N-acetyltransferase [Vibrio genomosp. F10]|uniref:GNAT family N-acetyltransferase n=1 Tax=Vibrio genomosp. F10 TaxID=723171 RepID=UPI000379EED9|nr:GNAT family N-acetyltransferase [Vibrio genomosp. F10]OEF06256.1 tRNA cytosine(34) acetyltransferase TmcA [Vibrio genomosp. F10 str. 9ZD137]
MSTPISFLSKLSSIAIQNHIRFGVVLRGQKHWQEQTVQQFMDVIYPRTIYQLGGEPFSSSDTLSSSRHVPFKQGKRLLGQECQLLICDFSQGFDANSFSAAIGTLVGGGILVIIPSDRNNECLAQLSFDAQWLEKGLYQLLNIEQNSTLPRLPDVADIPINSVYHEQEYAIKKIVRVVEGHRKRPLMLTADRGRGKTAALGLASAQLMMSKSLDIIVTAPTLTMVSPLFHHAALSLSLPVTRIGELDYSSDRHSSSIRFVAPDDLIQSKHQCDLLIVDEAAAIPVPMLKTLVQRYHRLVLSSTIHGYEGSGRGFSLKFIPWLKNERPGSSELHLKQPIRWQQHDPLELWHNTAFLLDADCLDIDDIDIDRIGALVAEQPNLEALSLVKVEKSQLIGDPALLRRCFGLLVNAHYQTSPNDLFHLLGDNLTCLYVLMLKDECLGCMVTVEEGGLSREMVELIQQGKRRPPGQLVSVSIVNQLGIAKAALDKSLRIMRIAVHPAYQGINIGSLMLKQLQQRNKSSFLSTSFGATSELIRFWRNNHFSVVRVGSQRDKASGCYSVTMINGDNVDWLDRAEQMFAGSLEYRVSDSLTDMEFSVLRAIYQHVPSSHRDLSQEEMNLLQFYVQGGASFDSIAFILRRLIASILSQENGFSLSVQLSESTAFKSSSAFKASSTCLVTDLLIAKVLQQKSWLECSAVISASGRKQSESQLKQDIESLLCNLQCKLSTKNTYP